jgi:hypothetical protein
VTWRAGRAARKGVVGILLCVGAAVTAAYVGLPLGALTLRAHARGHPITICHRTDSETSPYVRETVDEASIRLAGHELHTGTVWFNGHPKEPKWGDIIPPTDNDHDVAVAALNWTAAGQALWNNRCAPMFGPPPEAPKITCTLISVDPPRTSWITVTFIGTINGVPFSRSATYGNPTPHLAIIDISDLTTAPGPLQIVAYAIWTLGPGHSDVAAVTITCHTSAHENR